MNSEEKNNHQGESWGFRLEVYPELGLELKTRYEREGIQDESSGKSNDIGGRVHVFPNNREIWLEQ